MLRHHLIPKLTLAFSIACSVAASALGAPAWAANADVPQTNFVDLTGGQAPVAAPASSASTQTKFIDLTGGNTTAPAAPPATAGSTAVRSVDLTNGATAPTPTRIDAARVPKTKTIDLAVPGAEKAAQQITDADYRPETVVITADADNDPYEETNRGRFASHVWLHDNVIDPVERLYIGLLPAFVRSGVHNALTNLEGPTVFVNDVLQIDPPRAANTALRFAVNSTAGIGGLFDVGEWIGLPYRDDDFGMTLANYGVSDYPYLLVPVIGPSNPRDMVGNLVDIVINPLHYVTVPGGIFTSLGREAFHQADKRQEEVGQLDALQENAPDPYAAERSMAREKRQAEINGE